MKDISTSVKFSERKQWLKKIYFTVCLIFSTIIICAYIFAWLRGASNESILVSGLAILIFNILFFSIFYLISIKLSKQYCIDDELESQKQNQWDFRYYLFLSVILACDIVGVVIIIVKKMFLLGLIISTLSTIIFCFSVRKKLGKTG